MDDSARLAAMPTLVAWIETQLGVVVDRHERLVGGMSCDVSRIWCDDGASYVVRHIADSSALAGEPWLIAQEGLALDLLVTTDVPAPNHVLSDGEARVIVTSFLDGHMVSAASELVSRVGAIAELAVAIALVPLPPGVGLGEWQPWTGRCLVPPDWGDAGLWTDAIAAFASMPQPTCDHLVLLHRDLHPLNVLWRGDDVVGVVDWVNACVGHPHAELGHTRWNLAVLAGQPAAEGFLAAYLAMREAIYDPWWDLATVLSLLPGPIGISGWHAVGRTDLTDAVVIDSTERFVRSALDRL